MMTREITRTLAFAGVFLFAGYNAMAQGTFRSANPKSVILKMTPAEKARAKADFRANYPYLNHALPLPSVKKADGNFHRSNTSRVAYSRPSAAGNILRASDVGTELWGMLSWAGNWNQNYYDFNVSSFAPVAPLTLTKQGSVAERMADAGAAVVGNKYYAMSADFTLAAYGYVYVQLFTYDTDTWEPIKTADGQDYEVIKDYSLIALETAQAQDGTVYGEFYRSDLSSQREWGIIDYATKTRTTIGNADHEYVALGVTSDNHLYGVATDGNLYSISTSDGTETLVGSTGITVTNSQGQYYGQQSGEIDPKTNTFYWEFISPETAVSTLYTVDLNTGHATAIGNFPNNEWLSGLLVPNPAAEAGAPARATGLSSSFSGASTSGDVTFTAPSTTYSGAALSGQLDYFVLAGTDTLASGTTTAGAATTAHVAAAPEGEVQFSVQTRNAAGFSPRAKVTDWIGYDIPAGAQDVRLSTSGQDAHVTWSAPAQGDTAGTHGGYVGPSLTYDVYRSVLFEDTTLVAENTTATSIDDRIPDGPLKTYTYLIYIHNGNRTSAASNSNSVIAGSAIEPPYNEPFNSSDNFYAYTVKNKSKDADATWTYNSSQHCVWSYSIYGNVNDCWLITPFVHLGTERTYHLAFKARNGLPSSLNTLQVLYGTGDDENTYQVIMPDFKPAFQWTEYGVDVTVPAEGAYKFAFRDVTPTHEYRIFLDSITVTANALQSAPDSVTAFTAAAGDRGAISASLSFAAPEKAVDGSAIASVDSFQILRNDTLVATIDGAVAGATVNWTDNTLKSAGNYKYTVIAWNAVGYGRTSAARTVYVGLDIPDDPANVTMTDAASKVNISWDPIDATGQHGGYVNPSDVTVDINEISSDVWGRVQPGTLVGSVRGMSSFDLPVNPSEGEQTVLQYLIASRNDAGTQGYLFTPGIIVGQPYVLPYKESNVGDSVGSFMWGEQGLMGPTASISQDGDGGAFYWTSMNYNDSSVVSLGKFSLDGATNPQLVFYYYANAANDPMRLYVDVQTPDGTRKQVAAYNLASATKAGWTLARVSLADFIGQSYIIPKFRAISQAQNGGEGEIGIDNINIRDIYEYDLDATVTASSQITKGQTANAVVNVTNYGSQSASGYTVNIYSGDDLIAYSNSIVPLAPFASATYTFSIPTSSLIDAQSLNVKAVVDYDSDLEPDNNTATATVLLKDTDLPAPSSITVDGEGKSTVIVNWTEPAETPVETTETFEHYAPWATTFGDWTTVDGDKALGGSIFSDDTPFPLTGQRYAFAIFNPASLGTDILTNNPFIAAHNGQQYAGVMFESDGTNFVNSDNWLISPKLSGEAQTVRFFVRNVKDSQTDYVEQFDFLASPAGNDTTSFSRIATGVSVSGGEWQEMSYPVPAGTNYFAIHQTTSLETAYQFAVDDATFRTIAEKPESYNIYCDGEIIGRVDATGKLSFTTYPSTSGNHEYSVTAVYSDGSESAPVSASVTTTTGITNITVDGAADDQPAYNLAGQRVNNNYRGIVVTKNRKVVRK